MCGLSIHVQVSDNGTGNEGAQRLLLAGVQRVSLPRSGQSSRPANVSLCDLQV